MKRMVRGIAKAKYPRVGKHLELQIGRAEICEEMFSMEIRQISIECNARRTAYYKLITKEKKKLLSTYSIKNSLKIRKNRTNIIKRELELRCKTMSAQFIVLENEFQDICFMKVD